MAARDYTYSVFYSQEDESYIATVAGMPSLSAFGNTPSDALAEIVKVTEFCIHENMLPEKPTATHNNEMHGATMQGAALA